MYKFLHLFLLIPLLTPLLTPLQALTHHHFCLQIFYPSLLIYLLYPQNFSLLLPQIRLQMITDQYHTSMGENQCDFLRSKFPKRCDKDMNFLGNICNQSILSGRIHLIFSNPLRIPLTEHVDACFRVIVRLDYKFVIVDLQSKFRSNLDL